MTERIQKAIDVFLDAINNGTLAKGTCTACAVGNLVAAGKGGKITKSECYGFECSVPNRYWGDAFSTDYGNQTVYPEELRRLDVRKDIEATDFTAKELMQIEYAFEINTDIKWHNYPLYSKEEVRADQIRGLEAVVKVMLTFDEQPDDVKEVFTQKAEAIAV